MTWKNRIVEQRMVPLSELKANPLNWRLHPASQRGALDEVLGKVGMVQGVIFNQRTGHLVDGHLRLELAEKAGLTELPVTVVDLSEDDERMVLATLDPIGAMAAADTERLQGLIDSVSIPDDAPVAEALAGIIRAAKVPDDIEWDDMFAGGGLDAGRKDTEAVTFALKPDDAARLKSHLKTLHPKKNEAILIWLGKTL